MKISVQDSRSHKVRRQFLHKARLYRRRRSDIPRRNEGQADGAQSVGSVPCAEVRAYLQEHLTTPVGALLVGVVRLRSLVRQRATDCERHRLVAGDRGRHLVVRHRPSSDAFCRSRPPVDRLRVADVAFGVAPVKQRPVMSVGQPR